MNTALANPTLEGKGKKYGAMDDNTYLPATAPVTMNLLDMLQHNLPLQMRETPCFCVTGFMGKPKAPGDALSGRGAKPCTIGAGKWDTAKEKGWHSFPRVAETYRHGGWMGMGLLIAHPLVGIDLDHMRDPETGELTELGSTIVALLQGKCYLETSLSGTGIHAWGVVSDGFYQSINWSIYAENSRSSMAKDALGDGFGGQQELECYVGGHCARFFTLTGDVLGGVTDLTEPCDEEILTLLDTYLLRDFPSDGTTSPSTGTPPDLEGTAAGTGRKPDSKDSDLGPIFDEVRQRVSCLDVAHRYGLDVDRRNFSLCPFHAEKTPSMHYITPVGCKASVFHCFGCQKSGDSITLAAQLNGLPEDKHGRWEALKKLNEDFSLGLTLPEPGQPKRKAPRCKINANTTRNGEQETPPPPAGPKEEDIDILVRWLAEEQVDLLHNSRYSWDDIGNGYLFADCFQHRLRYCPEKKSWFCYDGMRWLQDVGGLATAEWCKALGKALLAFAATIEDDELRSRYVKFLGIRWQTRRGREIILKDAMSVFPIYAEAFDKDPFLLNCENGELDLHTRQLRPHSPASLCAKLANVVYDPAAQSPLWEQTVEEIMGGDQDTARFLQKYLGYSLTGDTRQECFALFYGPTSRNGKSTILGTFLHLMGEYALTATPDLIALKKGATTGPNEALVLLRGARFVSISELPKGLKLDSATVKTLTGGDAVRARALYENSVEFIPICKILLNTNFLPRTDDTALFASDRVRVIPFLQRFVGAGQNQELKAELLKGAQQSAVLNWALDGLRLLEEEGLPSPPAVASATAAYRVESDQYTRFLTECFAPDPLAETTTTDAYELYKGWCAAQGKTPERQAAWKIGMSTNAQIKKKRPRGADRIATKQTFLLGYRMREIFGEGGREGSSGVKS